MQVKPLLSDRSLFLAPDRRRRFTEGIFDQRRDGAESQRGKIQYARGQDLQVPVRTPGIVTRTRDQRADHEPVSEAVPSLVELEALFLDRWDVGFGGLRRWIRREVFGCLVGGVRGPGKHLNHLLECGGVGLDEGGRVGIGFGSGNGFWG